MATQRSVSSGWTSATQPSPRSSESERPVKSSQGLLNAWQRLSGPDDQIITGAMSRSAGRAAVPCATASTHSRTAAPAGAGSSSTSAVAGVPSARVTTRGPRHPSPAPSACRQPAVSPDEAGVMISARCPPRVRPAATALAASTRPDVSSSSTACGWCSNSARAIGSVSAVGAAPCWEKSFTGGLPGRVCRPGVGGLVIRFRQATCLRARHLV